MFENLSYQETEGNTPHKLLIYGTYGVGKTVFAESHHGTVYLLDMENGSNQYAKYLPHVKRKKCTSWNDIYEALKWIEEETNKGTITSNDCLVLDSETVLWDTMQYERSEAETKGGTIIKNLNIADWGVVKKIVKNIHTKLAQFPIDVIALAHEKKSTNGESITSIEPSCEGNVPYYFDAVLRFTKDYNGVRKLLVEKRRGSILNKDEYDITDLTYYDVFKEERKLEINSEEKTKNYGIKIMFARSKQKLQEIIDQFKEDATLSEEQKKRLKVLCKEKVSLL